MERLPNGAMSEEEFIELFGEETYQHLPQNRLIQLNKKYYVAPLESESILHSREMDQYFFWDWIEGNTIYKNKNDVAIELAEQWDDVGHLENYFSTKQFLLKARYFNSLQFDDFAKIVTKKS